jgi:hypothetical protein
VTARKRAEFGKERMGDAKKKIIYTSQCIAMMVTG